MAAGGIIVALLGVFVPGPEKMLDVRLAWTLSGTVVVGAIAFRLPRSFGAPLSFSLVAVAVFFAFALEPWRTVSPGDRLLEFTVLARTEETLTVEAWIGDERYFGSIAAPSVVARVELLYADEPWFFVSCYARASGLLGAAGDPVEIELADHDRRSSSTAKAASFALRVIDRLPGWSRSTVESEAVHPKPLYRYVVYVEEKNRIGIAPAVGME